MTFSSKFFAMFFLSAAGCVWVHLHVCDEADEDRYHVDSHQGPVDPLLLEGSDELGAKCWHFLFVPKKIIYIHACLCLVQKCSLHVWVPRAEEYHVEEGQKDYVDQPAVEYHLPPPPKKTMSLEKKEMPG
jgi:hypothetical protein